jgi:hypothetical protein
MIETDPNYTYVAARLLMEKVLGEALTLVSDTPEQVSQAGMVDRHAPHFQQYVNCGIELDNGPKLISRVLDHWTANLGIKLGFIYQGKPEKNAVMDGFKGRFRDECLNSPWSTRLTDARQIIETWRLDYNQVRPHSSFNYATPQEVHGKLTGSLTTSNAARLSQSGDQTMGAGHFQLWSIEQQNFMALRSPVQL